MSTITDFPGVALVTGAASGIGFAVVKAFAKAGCDRIILVDLNAEGLKAALIKLDKQYPGKTFITSTVDISEPGAMAKALEKVAEDTMGGLDRVDYAVNCAGMNGINASHAPTNSTETSLEYFDKLNGINYRGTWMANRAYLNVMLKQEPLPAHDENPKRMQRGSIVNLSSGLGLIGMPKNPVYSASKAALIALTRNDAIDYSEHKIRVNCVCPGLIDTPMTTAMGDDPKAMEWVVNSTPLGRMGMAEEIADVCVFLSSSKASWIQGQSIVADGGIVLL